MDVKIRCAQEQDAAAVIGLLTAFAYYENLEPPSREASARLVEDGWGPCPRFEAWLAELGDEPVALAMVFSTYSTFLARPTLYIEDLYVVPECRNQGVGTALLLSLIQGASSRGYARVEWTCPSENTRAHAFYERQGAQRLGKHSFRICLPRT